MTTNAETSWRNGVSLSEAIEKYSDENLYNEFMRLHEEFSIDLSDVRPQPANFEDNKAVAPDYFERHARYLQLPNLLQHDVLAGMKLGAFITFGYRRPRERDDIPTLIDPHHWKVGTINWDQSSLITKDQSFEKIRIIDARRNPNLSAAFFGDAESKSQIGRPSQKQEIQAAYNWLKDQGRINFRNKAANYENIRGVVLSNGSYAGISDSGLSNETIRRAIGEDFARDKAEYQKTSKLPSKPAS